jgi:hypothetical protein
MISATRRCALAVACALAALPAAPAAATPPTVEVEPFHEVEVIPAGAACDFEIILEHDGTFVTTTFYDRDGSPIRQLLRFGEHFTETYSANGRSLTTISIAPAHVDLATGETTATGNLRLITVPGAGVLYATAGHYVIVSATGEVLDFSGLDVPPGEEICAALSA